VANYILWFLVIPGVLLAAFIGIGLGALARKADRW
jgi:hypothetical protein